MATEERAQTSVKSAMRTLDIIELIVAHPEGMIAQDVAEALAIPVSSLSYLLSTLVDRGYLSREGRRYRPGVGLERLRSDRLELPLAARAKPLIQSIRGEMNETVSLFAIQGWELEAVLTETSEQNLRYSIGVGERVPMHCVAAGKAVLAAFDAPTLDRFFREAQLTAFTDMTLSDEAALRREIETVRQTGLAFTRDEYTLGISGGAKAIVRNGCVVGALSIAVPTVRFNASSKKQVQSLLTKAVAQLEK